MLAMARVRIEAAWIYAYEYKCGIDQYKWLVGLISGIYQWEM